jgi:hypothetical protein
LGEFNLSKSTVADWNDCLALFDGLDPVCSSNEVRLVASGHVKHALGLHPWKASSFDDVVDLDGSDGARVQLDPFVTLACPNCPGKALMFQAVC